MIRKSKLGKYKNHQHKRPTLIHNIDVNKIALSNKTSFGKTDLKYIIGYKYAKKIWPLLIFFYCQRDFDNTKCMSSQTKDEKLLEKHNEIWQKVSNISKKIFDGNPIYNKNTWNLK